SDVCSSDLLWIWCSGVGFLSAFGLRNSGLDERTAQPPSRSAPKGFEPRSKRRPISAVFCLLGARLGIQRFAQCLALARKIQAEQWAAAALSASFVGESMGQTDEALRCSGH